MVEYFKTRTTYSPLWELHYSTTHAGCTVKGHASYPVVESMLAQPSALSLTAVLAFHLLVLKVRTLNKD